MRHSLPTFLFLLVISMLFSNIGYSQIGNVIGRHKASEKKIPSLNKKDLIPKNLAKHITKNCNTDMEKANAIFIWVATNISYDNELRLNKKLQKEFYSTEENVIKKTLERKKALCGGYAFLYKELCKQVGLQSEVINGFSKKYYKASETNKVDHTWNAVKINGKWKLLDITLAQSHGINNTPDVYWFCTDPNYFIKTHYPENKKWTLLNNPISKSEFEKLPSK